MRATATLLAAVLAIVLSLGTPASLRADDTRARLAALDPKYRDWLEEVDLLIAKDERRQFLALTRDYQRDGFIHRFWEARNPVPGSARNAFKAQWEGRVAAIRAEYGNITEDRARMRLLHGEPGGESADVIKTDCGMALWPLEIWHYPGGERLPRNLYLVFYAHGGGGYRLWRRSDGLGALIARLSTIDPVDLGEGQKSGPSTATPDQNLYMFEIWARDNCGGLASNVVAAVQGTDREDMGGLLDQVFAPPARRRCRRGSRSSSPPAIGAAPWSGAWCWWRQATRCRPTWQGTRRTTSSSAARCCRARSWPSRSATASTCRRRPRRVPQARQATSCRWPSSATWPRGTTCWCCGSRICTRTTTSGPSSRSPCRRPRSCPSSRRSGSHRR